VQRLALGVLSLASAVFGADLQQEKARQLYDRADFHGSLQLLFQLPKRDANASELIGRNYYMLGEYKKAITSLEEAITLEPNDSNHYLWLGRAQGRRAEHANPLVAPSCATKARVNFEKAVELNPRNVEALSDLFEYYLEAPGFLGGGFDKATAIANRIAELDRVEAHYARYRLAEKKGDLASAEKALRCAQPERIVDLARFLAKHGRFQESDALFQSAEMSRKPGVLFDRAETYIRHGRNLDQARDLLKRYLAAELSPDDPPRRDAEKLLKRSL